VGKTIEATQQTVKPLTEAELEEWKRLGARVGCAPEELKRLQELDARRIVVDAEELVASGRATRRMTMFRDAHRRRWYSELIEEHDPRFRASRGPVLYDARHFRQRLRELAAQALARR